MKLQGKGHCSYCDIPDVFTRPVEGWRSPGETEGPDMCEVCYGLGAGYTKDALSPLRFDQFSRGIRLVLSALDARAPQKK